MARACYRASAPGKLMLLGEHAVVYGCWSVVAAVNRRLHVTLTPRDDRRIIVSSDLGRHETDLEHLQPDRHSRFVIAVLASCRNRVPSGCEVTVEADFDDKVGLGSSAAITAAMLGVVDVWCGMDLAKTSMLDRGLQVIRDVQGSGSGADLAASLYGGVLLYRNSPEVQRLVDDVPLSVMYSGIKASTPEVIRQVDQRRQRHERLVNGIFDTMHHSARQAAEAILDRDWPRLGGIFDINQGLMAALGVSTPELERLLGMLRRDPGIHGAKLSGAGMGDCLIGVGRLQGQLDADVLDLAVSPDGLQVDA